MKTKVLAVEDAPLSRFVLVSTLKALDCDVIEAETGEQAWNLLEGSGIRLVVGDWRLPGIDGLELCRRLRARGGEYVYYILLTELEANEANETLAIEAGVDDFLSKPVAPHELRNRLRVAERILGYTTQVRQLESFIPICGFCQRVRNDDHYWQQIDTYLSDHTGAAVERGICPDCYQNTVIPPLRELELAQHSTEEKPAPVATRGEKPRPTLSMIARKLGVTVATVSMALRNNPRISEEMRARVRMVAEEVGYHPDPTLGRMMHRLRSRRPTAFKSILCALTTIPEENEPRYLAQLIQGAQAQAVKRGYGITVMRLDEKEIDPWKLQRTLVHRGVEGLLILPTASPLACDQWLDWSQFSVATANLSVLAPDFDRVASHWYHSTKRLYAELTALGYRRIGAVINAAFDATVNHKITAAIAWHNLHDHLEPVTPYLFEAPLGDRLPAQALDKPATRRRPAAPSTRPQARPALDLQSWFEREQPEVIVVDNESYVLAVMDRLGLQVPGPVGIAVLNRGASSPYAGVSERPFEVGVAAIEMLDRKLQSDERGIPAAPIVTHVKGYWTATESVRAPSAVAVGV